MEFVLKIIMTAAVILVFVILAIDQRSRRRRTAVIESLAKRLETPSGTLKLCEACSAQAREDFPALAYVVAITKDPNGVALTHDELAAVTRLQSKNQ